MSRQPWAVHKRLDTRMMNGIDYKPDSPRKSDMLKLRRRETDASELAESNIWFNITLPTPTSNRTYSLRIYDFDVDLHSGLVLEDVALNSGRVFAHVHHLSSIRGKQKRMPSKSRLRPWQGLINLTLSEDSTYAAVSIDAQATDAHVHLSLDPAFEGTFTAKTIKPDASERATVAYTHGGIYSDLPRVYQTPFRTRHLHTGAAGWGSEEAAANGPSFAEIRSIHRSAHLDI